MTPDPIQHTCAKCGRQMTVHARYVGRQLKCVQCGEFFETTERPAAQIGQAPSAPAKEPTKGMFAPIDSRQAALKAVRESSICFFAIAGLQGVLALIVGPALLVDAAIFALLGFFLLNWHSRVAAVLLAGQATVASVVTLLNYIGVLDHGGRNVFLALIMLWAAIRALEATFKLHGRFAGDSA